MHQTFIEAWRGIAASLGRRRRHRQRRAHPIAALLLAFTATAQAAPEIHEYDAAGRLERITSDGGSRVTRYTYDALGNLISVRVVNQSFPPQVQSVEPQSVRAASSETIQLTGANLANASVLTADDRLAISDLAATADNLNFLLTLPPDAPLGEQQFRVSNPDGEASFSLEILPPLPVLSAAPLPLALPVDNSLRHFLVRLSPADTVDRRIALSLSDTSVATLEDQETTIPAGETEVRIGIRGARSGLSRLTLSSDGLETAIYTVYVTADYGSVNSGFSPALGLVVGEPGQPSNPSYADRSDLLGLVVGPHVEQVLPGALSVGSNAVPLTIHGVGLDTVDSIALQPSEGIVLSSPVAAADGSSLQTFATVAVNATLGYRKVILGGTDSPYPPAGPGADLVNITPPLPALASVTPNYGLRGISGKTITLRGHNLSQASAVSFDPPDGIIVGTDLPVNGDGTSLTATISIAADAPLGERTILVTTPAGTSTDIISPANRFQVVDRVDAVYQPIASSMLGLQVGNAPGTQPLNTASHASSLGVLVGPVALDLSPINAEKGTQARLTISGVALDVVDSASFEPATGITLEGLSAGASGDELTIDITMATDTPETWRRLRLYANGAEIRFADPRRARFLVTGPVPQVESLSPNTLKVGAGPTTITLRGRNLDHASRVNAVPPEGMQFGNPSVDAEGTSLTVSVEADAFATTGPRVLTVTNPAGTSSEVASVGNTLTLYEQAVAAPQDFTTRLLGVVIGQDGTGQPSDVLTTAPLVGVEVGDGGDPRIIATQAMSPPLGIAVGTHIESLTAPPLLTGDTYILTLHGQALDAVDTAGAYPSLDLAVGPPAPSPDGSRLMVELTIPPDAIIEPRELRLKAGEAFIPFLNPSTARLYPAAGIPEISSMTPITGRPGEVLELLVRGENLHNAKRVSAEPGEGIHFSPFPSVNPEGTELHIRLHLADDIAVGARTIRIETPGGVSSASASPANTFTVF